MGALHNWFCCGAVVMFCTELSSESFPTWVNVICLVSTARAACLSVAGVESVLLAVLPTGLRIELPHFGTLDICGKEDYASV
jgi:hypothetical protein